MGGINKDFWPEYTPLTEHYTNHDRFLTFKESFPKQNKTKSHNKNEEQQLDKLTNWLGDTGTKFLKQNH